MEQTALMFAAAHQPRRRDRRAAQGRRRRQGDVEGDQRRQPERAEQEASRRPAASGQPAATPGGATAPRRRRQAAPVPRRPRRGGGGGGRGGGWRGRRRSSLLLQRARRHQGGLTPLLFAARQGYVEAAKLLVAAGADVNQVSAGDKTSPLLIAIINGHFDLAQVAARAAAPIRTARPRNGVTPLYAALNVPWAPQALYPQPRAYQQQQLTYLDFMKALLDKGADPNAAPQKKVWYTGYNFDLSGVDEIGATPFWRAAYAGDVDAMRLLVQHGADPNIPTMQPAGRPRVGDCRRAREVDGRVGPAAGAGGRPACRRCRRRPASATARASPPTRTSTRRRDCCPASSIWSKELGADVNAVDHEGNTALHHAAARGDNEMILYLVSKGADVRASTAKGRPPPTWPTARCSARSRIPRRWRCSRSSAPRTTTNACRAES